MALPTVRSARPSTTAITRRWDPFSELEGLYDQMGQLMRSVVGDMPTAAAADIEETDDEFVVELDLAGVKREDVDVEVRQNQVRVSGEIKERERTGLLRRQSRPVGRFDYLVAVPGEIDPDKVEATLTDGVLTVRLGKAARSRPRHIEVKG
jgi:HSP20 family protein